MTIDRDLLQEVRLLFQRLVQPSGTALTDDQVIPADDDGPRPDLPYLTVRTEGGVQIGEAEVLPDASGGDWRARTRAWYRAPCSVNAYGAEAADWLAEFAIELQLPATVEYTEERSITVRPVGAMRNLSALLDTGFEPRYQQDFALDYGLLMTLADAETAPELAEVVLDDLDGEPGSYQREVTITLP